VFDWPDDIERAVIHIETPSFYELHINGQKVGPYVLTPGVSQHTKRFFINSYDVTSLLVKGRNCIAIWMGPGWHQPGNGNPYNAPIVRAQNSRTLSRRPVSSDKIGFAFGHHQC